MTAVAITFLSLGSIVLYGGLIATIMIAIICDKK